MINLIAAAIFALGAANQQYTVGECLLRSGYSHAVQSHPHLTNLSGAGAWGQADQDALRYGDFLGSEYVLTDTGRRKVDLIAYAGALYVFVYKHPDDPAAFEPMPGGGTAWHGDCMLRLAL